MKTKMISPKDIIMLFIRLFLLTFILPFGGCMGSMSSKNYTSTQHFLSECRLHAFKPTMCSSNGDRIVDESLRRNVCIRRGLTIPRTNTTTPTSTPRTSRSFSMATTMSGVSSSTMLSTTERPLTSKSTTSNKSSTRVETTRMPTTTMVTDNLTTSASTTTNDPTTSESTPTVTLTTNKSTTTETQTTDKPINTYIQTTDDITNGTQTTTGATTTDTGTTIQPTTTNPTTNEPTTTKMPTTSKPFTTKTPTIQPTTTNPATNEPTTTKMPTTSKPITTDMPTTDQPTSTNPTTNEPTTTKMPTTSEPFTTNMPTTDQPTTTEVTTTSSTTTAGSVNEQVGASSTEFKITTTTTTTATATTTATTPPAAPPSNLSLKMLAVDQCDHTIKISNLPTVSFDTLPLTIDYQPESVAYDSVSREVFWVDIEPLSSGVNQVCGSKLDGTSRRCKNIRDYCHGPRKIDIDETDRKLYCACSDNSRIIMMNLDLTGLQNFVDTTPVNVEFIATIPRAVVYVTGVEVRKFTTTYSNILLSTESHAVHGLAIDRTQEKIHFAVEVPTSATASWYKMNYDGTGRQLQTTRDDPPRDLEWYENNFYTVEEGNIFTVGGSGAVTNWNWNNAINVCPDVTDIKVGLM